MSDRNGNNGILSQIVVAVVITLLVGSSAPWWWPKIFPPPPDTPTPRPVISETRPSANPPTEITTEAPPSGCVITIENSLVPLMSEPDPFSQQLIRITPGRYSTLDYTTATFAGSQQGWFKIDVDGHIGWVQDQIVFIAEKTGACP